MTVIGQIIQCSDKDDMYNLIKALFIVALSETEGKNNFENDTICEINKKWLLQRISTGTIQEIDDINDQNNDPINIHEFPQEPPASTIKLSSSFVKLVKNIHEQCLVILKDVNEVGDRGNQQLFPELIPDFINMCDLLPLWTDIMRQFFPKSHVLGSSTSVESNFNDLKHRIFCNSLPTGLEDFIKKHIRSNQGAMVLAHSDMDLITVRIEYVFIYFLYIKCLQSTISIFLTIIM